MAPSGNDCPDVVEGDYERIDAEMDRDEIYSKLLSSLMEDGGEGPVDQFFRVIEGP